MVISTSRFFSLFIVLPLLLFLLSPAKAQRTFASGQQTGASGILCVNCTVTNAANAADGNLESFSTLNVSVGVAALTWQDLIFTGSSALPPGTTVTVKLGTGNSLLSLQALGGITLQAYNGSSPAGAAVAANTLLTLLSNNNQADLNLTPTQPFDRIRVTLNGSLAGALSSIYLYEAFYNGNAPESCNMAYDELNGISSGLLNLGLSVGGVVNPQLAIDGNINTASTLNAGVGLVGAYAQQTLIFNSLSTIGDSVRLTLSIPQALLDAGVLSNISVSTFNGNTSNNDALSLNSSLLNVRLLDGTTNRKVTVTFAPSKIFDRVQLTLGGGIANVLSSLNFYEGQRLIPRPIVKYNNAVAGNVSVCAGSTAALTVTPVANTIFNWYTQQTGGTPVYTGTNFTTPALSAATTYYVEAVRTGCTDASERTPVTITVNAIPAAPVIANSTQTICSGQPATFAVQSIPGVNVNWYTAATGGVPVFTGNTFTTPALTQTTSYYAEAVSGTTCVSASRTQVTATVQNPPALPALSAPDVTVCDSTVAVLSVSNPQAGYTYNWYSTETGGTVLYTGSTFTTPALTSNTDYYVEAVNSTGCTSTGRTHATVTVQPLTQNPAAAANNTTVAAGQSATLNVTNPQTGINYNWYTSGTASTPVYTGTTFTTPALYSTTTYYVNAVSSAGCASAGKTPVTVNVTLAVAPCSFANQQTSNANGICIGCNVTNNALAADGDTTTASALHIVAGLTGGYVQQELDFQQPGFAGDTIKLGLQSPVNLSDVNIGGQITILVYNGATLVNQYSLNNTLIKVRLLNAGTGRYAAYIPATAAYDRVVVRLNSGTATLLTALQVYYAQQLMPKPVVNPASPEICKGSTAQLNITAPANGTFNWYTTPTGGAPVYTGTNFTTPALTANTTFYIEYTRNGCTGATRYPLQVLVDNAPAAPTVAVNNVTINSGQTATLVATPPANATINWYTAATGGTPVATGNTFTTPALTANTTYYTEAASGSCVSGTRTPVTVTVNPVIIPDVTVTPPAQSISPGQNTTFTASSTTAGAVFNWYTTPTGGTPVYTGATFTTPAEFANMTFYAEATVPATGAVSATRAAATVNVVSSGTSPVACDAAIDQTTDINGTVCVGCTVLNAGGAVDNDRNTFSQINITAGLVNAYAQQTLRFANTGHAQDSVIVELGVPGSLANVSTLSGISLATYNGTTYNNDRFTIDGTSIHVSLLGGQSRFRIAFAAQHDFDRVEIRLTAAAAGVLNALDIYDAAQEVAAPTIATANTSTCAGSQVTLTATASADATIKWYTAATGGTPIFTGAVFTTPVLNITTTYYAEASRTTDGCAQTVRTPASIAVTSPPAAPVIPNSTVTVCSGQPAAFTVQSVNGVTYNWYTTPTGGTPVATGNSFTSPALTATTTYYAEAASGTCTSATRTAVTANVSDAVANPTVAQSPVQICSGSSAVLTASSAQPGASFNWYATATGGTPLFTGAQFTTPALTADTAYYVEAATGTCTSPQRTRAALTVNPAPVAPTLIVAPAGGQITSGQTAQITATSPTGGVTFNWYTAPTGGTSIFTGPAFTTPVLTSNTTYYAESVSPSGCTSSRTAANITVNPVFSVSCDFASTQTTDVNGGLACVNCGVTNPDYAVDTDTTNYSRLNLPVAVSGSYVAQQLIFADNGSAGDTVTVKIRIPASIAGASALSQLQIASYNGVTYNNDRVNVSSGAIGLQVLAGGQTALVKFAPSAAFDRVEVRLNSSATGLFNSADLFYASKQVAAPQLSASTANICSGNTATFNIANPKNNVTYKWYATPTGGSAVYTGTSFTTPVLNATTTYYAESQRTTNSCPNPNRVAATVNVTPGPVTPVLAQTAIQTCAGQAVSLNVTNAGTATINWYDAATGGNLLFTGATYQVTPLATTTYYAEATNSNCISAARATVTVTVNPTPAKPGVAAQNVTVCTGSTATLQVNGPESGVSYDWFTTATGGTSVFTGANFTTSAITQNTTYYVQGSTAAGCTNDGGRTAVNITTNGTINAPTLSSATTQVCSGGNVSLSVVNPVSGLQYNWFTTATGGAVVFTGTTLNLTDLTADASYFVEAANGTGCVSATRTETDVTVLPIPTKPVIQADGNGLNICTGSSANLSIVNPQADAVYRWFDSPNGGTLLYTGVQFNTPALTANTTYYVEAANAGNCNPSDRTAVTINVNALPADPVLANANVNVCAGAPATFTISSPQSGVTYQWFDSAAETNKLTEGTTFTTGAITANTTFYVSAVNSTGCTSSNFATASAAVQLAPQTPLIANGSTVQTCTGSAVTLSIADPQAGYIYHWYSDAASTTPLYTGISFTTPVLSSNAIYYADAVNPTGCASANRSQVSINVNTPPPAPAVTAADGSTNPVVCPGASAMLKATSTTPDVTFNWYTTPSGGTAVFTGATFTTPALTANTNYFVEAVSNNGGCVSATRTAIQVTISNTTAAQPQVSITNLTTCQNTAAVIHIANPDANTVYNWYNAATGGTAVYTGTTFTTPVLTASATYYVQAVSSQSCNPSDRLSVTVNVVPPPAAPSLVAATVPICAGSTATLQVAAPQAGVTYNWYDSPSKTNLLFTGSVFVTPAINANTNYYVEASNGSCSSTSALVQAQVTVTPAPTAPMVVSNAISTCTGSAVTLGIANPQTGYTYNWYSSATGGSSVYTGANFNIPAISASATYYAEAVNSAGCTSAARTPVNISVTPAPANLTISSTDNTVCPGTSATLTAASTDAGVTINWYDSATGGRLLATGASYTTPALTSTTTYYAEAVNSNGCTSSARTAAMVYLIPALIPPVVTLGDVTATSITFNWKNVDGATGYLVSLDNGKTFVTPSSGDKGLSETVAGLQPNQSAIIIVKALGPCGNDAVSDAFTGKTLNPIGDMVWIPNAFTPNGDGTNDILYVYGTAINHLTLYVYDQWGELQFRSDRQSSGWDGTYHGKQQPVGVYVYYVEATMNDGQVIKKKGTINLIR